MPIQEPMRAAAHNQRAGVLWPIIVAVALVAAVAAALVFARASFSHAKAHRTTAERSTVLHRQGIAYVRLMYLSASDLRDAYLGPRPAVRKRNTDAAIAAAQDAAAVTREFAPASGPQADALVRRVRSLGTLGRATALRRYTATGESVGALRDLYDAAFTSAQPGENRMDTAGVFIGYAYYTYLIRAAAAGAKPVDASITTQMNAWIQEDRADTEGPDTVDGSWLRALMQEAELSPATIAPLLGDPRVPAIERLVAPARRGAPGPSRALGDSVLAFSGTLLAASDAEVRASIEAERAAAGTATLHGRLLVGAAIVLAIGGLLGLWVLIARRRRWEAHLHDAVNRDALTGLLNRRGLAMAAMQAAAAEPGGVALLLCDLDRFKEVNDKHGHAAGDQLLVAFAERLGRVRAADDAIARLGGDEFAVLLRGLADAQTAAGAVAERLLAELDEPVDITGGARHVRTSIGAAYSDSPTSLRALLIAADAALYEAKAAGRGRAAARRAEVEVQDRTEQVASFMAAPVTRSPADRREAPIPTEP